MKRLTLLHSAVDGVVSHVSRLQKEAKEFANKKKKQGFEENDKH